MHKRNFSLYFYLLLSLYSSVASSATVQTDGSTSTGISSLVVGTTIYDVTFVYDTIDNLVLTTSFEFWAIQ